MLPGANAASNSQCGEAMAVGADNISRISKLLIDRDKLSPDAALSRRKDFAVTLVSGDDVARSYTLQLAVLTAARIATRCFPAAVHLVASQELLSAPLRLWPQLGQTFGGALAAILGHDVIARAASMATVGHALVFGDAPTPSRSLRVTFDGWSALVGPVASLARKPERELFPPVGILAASLGLSELFLSFADVSVQATRRIVGLSLWRPDLSADHPDAFGKLLEWLPAAEYLLGLGHLGNCFLWTLGSLPYADPAKVQFSLVDYDRVEDTNVETCLLLATDDVGDLKTRACAAWLKSLGFQTRLIERCFDSTFRRQTVGQGNAEPGLAFCGFDSNAARRHLATAEFPRVIECGLGAMAHNFDTLSLHTLPHGRSVAELWPDPTPDQLKQIAKEHERIARENPGYANLAKDDCGRALLAGKAVGVPFVGATAACLAVAESARLLHRGPAYSDIKLNLGDPDGRTATMLGNYGPEAAIGITFTEIRSAWR